MSGITDMRDIKAGTKPADVKGAASKAGKPSASSALWHRWVVPLASVMDTHDAPLDSAAIEAGFASIDETTTAKRRAAMLALLRDQLDTARTRLESELTATRDGVIYVGLNA